MFEHASTDGDAALGQRNNSRDYGGQYVPTPASGPSVNKKTLTAPQNRAREVIARPEKQRGHLRFAKTMGGKHRVDEASLARAATRQG